jgi:hypothetical protein
MFYCHSEPISFEFLYSVENEFVLYFDSAETAKKTEKEMLAMSGLAIEEICRR